MQKLYLMNDFLLTQRSNFVTKNILLLLFVIFTTTIFAQGNTCATATSLTINGACDAGTISDATQNAPNITGCAFSNFRREGWYTFTVTGGPLDITITADAADRGLYLQLISSTSSCTGLAEVTCQNADGTNNSAQIETITTSLANGIYYVKVVNEGNNNNMILNSICVSGSSASAYCTPINTYSTSYYISGVTTAGGIANINNTGTGFSSYTDYSSQFVSQYPGTSFSLTATHPSSTHGYNVWVDWNDDGDFDDVGENVISTGYLATPASLGNVTIPSGQAVGSYRMRIRNAYLSNPAPACGSFDYGEAEDYTVQVIALAACSGAPTAGTTTASPVSGSPGSSYTVSATGFSSTTGLTFQWQYSTNGGTTWVNQGAATGTYSNYIATAPAMGITTNWRLVVTCTSSGQSANSNSATFNSVSTLNVPNSGNNTLSCGNNITLYDNGGSSGDYVNNSNGYTVLEAGFGATINISGSYTTEGVDYIRLYSGVGTGGALLATYSGTGVINYTGTPGETITVRFSSDSSVVYSGFALAISYSGVCYPACSGTPSGGTVTVSPATDWTGNPYTVSATGYTQALNITYQWQFSTDGGTTWSNVGLATSTYADYSATAPASGLVHWQLEVTCVNSGFTGTSSVGIFTTLEVSTVATGCPNVMSGGLGLSGSDPDPITCVSASQCVDLEAAYLDLGDTSSYIVEAIAYNPPFAFSGLTNPVSVNTDDVWSPVVTLPFEFCFYGNTYTECLIGSNGVITFDMTNSGGTGYSFANNLPSTTGALFANSIYGVYHDIDPGVSGEIGWELVTLATGCRALVASWSDVPLFGDNNVFYTGMMVLYENSNIIEVYIQDKPNDTGNWNDNNAIVGIQNAGATVATVAPGRNGLDTDWTATNEAWRFVPAGPSITSVVWHEGLGVSGPVVGTTDVISVCPAQTTIYTAEVTYTLCDGSTITEIDDTVVTVNKDKTWDGSTSSDWNVANNWTPSGVPLITESVYIPNVANDPIIGAGADALACSLSVESGAVLTLNSGRNMTVTGAIAVAAGGVFNVMNSANLVQVDDAAINMGNINMERITNVRLQDYSYWSSPVNAFPVQSVSPATPAGFIFEWQTTTANPNGGEGYWVNTSESMFPAKGYILRAPTGFTNAATSALTANFIGVPNNGVFSPTIYRGNDYITPGTQSILRTITDDNWNLIGNPYPSSIGVKEFISLPANNSIVGGIRVWTHGQLPTNPVDPFYQDFVTNYYPSDYVVYNLVGATSGPGDPTIGAGQGFMVLMNAGAPGSGTVTFNNAMRGASLSNSVFYRSANPSNTVNAIEQNRIWLDLVASTGAVNRMLVGYVTDATQAEDRLYDSFTDYKPSQNFYSLIGNSPMAIQGRALPFVDSDRVNLGVTIPQDGMYSIALSALDGLFETTSQDIYIEDLENKIIHNLRDTPYSFMAVAGNNTNRFVLRYTDNRLGNDDLEDLANNIWVVANDNLSIKSTSIAIKTVTIHDVLGRIISNKNNVNSNEVSFENIQKNNTTLLVRIELTNGTIVNKKVIY